MTIKAKWTVGILTVFLWAIGCCLYCYWYVTSILAQPGWDAYVYSVGFQVLMFMLLRFPFLLVALFVILVIEAMLCNLDQKET